MPENEKRFFAYLDIETTGLSPLYGYITVVGIHMEHGDEERTVQLVGKEITSERLLEVLDGVEVLYTYNGARFDLPFIREKLGIDLAETFQHKDLMFECWSKNLFGGLKTVELKLGIPRSSTGINGLMAVELWRLYKQYDDRWALDTLLKYNREDVINLKTVRQKLEEIDM
jgi:uncharacterized protein YprB with RNaseH-like and TPR domain